MTLDLMFFNALLMLVICLPDKDMNFEVLSVLIGTIICLLEDSFVVILILGFSFLSLLIVLWTSSIFFRERLGKFSLIFKISLMLVDDACIYYYLFLLLELTVEFLPFFWKNFNFSRTFLLDLDRIKGEILEISAFLLTLLVFTFLLDLMCIIMT